MEADMSNFENYDLILPDGVVIENEKADKEGRKKRMSAMCVKVREQTNMNRKEFAEFVSLLQEATAAPAFMR